MSPSDMGLQIGAIHDYNNKVVIATDQQTLAQNNNTNPDTITVKPSETNEGTATKPPKVTQKKSSSRKFSLKRSILHKKC